MCKLTKNLPTPGGGGGGGCWFSGFRGEDLTMERVKLMGGGGGVETPVGAMLWDI